MDILLWAVLAVVFAVIEIVTIQLVSIWLAAAALLTMILAVVFDDMPFIAQTAVFVVSSAVFLAISLPFLKKRAQKPYTATNSELDIGKSAQVIEEIDINKNSGRVTLNGVDWSAVSENGDIIPKDSIVIITAVKGSKLTVKSKI